jgi:SnoaL-like domain
MAKVLLLSDADQIRNLIASYAHYADSGDAEALQSLYDEDGCVVEYGIPVYRDRMPELLRRAAAVRTSVIGACHAQMNTRFVSLSEGDAQVVTDVVVLDLDETHGWEIGGVGRYHDDIVKRDNHWMFRRREVVWHGGLGRHPHQPHRTWLLDLFESMTR